MREPTTPRELVAELRGTTCRCGADKKSRHTFCSTCYYVLTPTLRHRLYLRIGEGYESAYAEAATELDAEGRPRAAEDDS